MQIMCTNMQEWHTNMRDLLDYAGCSENHDRVITFPGGTDFVSQVINHVSFDEQS